MTDVNDAESTGSTEEHIQEKIIEGAEIVVSLTDTGTQVINPFDDIRPEPPSEAGEPSESPSSSDSEEGQSE